MRPFPFVIGIWPDLKGIRRAFKTALKETGIQDFRFHNLRHCAATNLRQAGVDTATARRAIC
ncbi:MAG: tyrosine-type recombinase/integrase [Nitrospirales bacterium]